MDPWSTLYEEFFVLQKDLLQDDSLIARRNFFRSTCANVEGTLNYLMGVIAMNSSLLSELEKLAFREKQIKVKEDGSVIEINQYIKTKTKIKMVFSHLSNFSKVAPVSYKNNSTYDKLITSFDIRDRLMHPRNDSDLQISSEQVQSLIDGYKWYISKYQDILNNIT